MSSMTSLDYLLLALILLGIGVSIFRSGAANPISTGRLSSRLSAVETQQQAQAQQIQALDERIENGLTRLEGSVDDVRQAMATRADLAGLQRTMEGERALAERTWHAIDRLQQYLIENGLGRSRTGA